MTKECHNHILIITYYRPTTESKNGNKLRKRAKVRNRYNQAPHLTQDTNGKVTNSQLDITNESQEVSPFPAGDHKASTDVHEIITKQDRNSINDPQKKHRLGTVSKDILLEGLNRFNGVPTSPLVHMWKVIKEACIGGYRISHIH